VFLQKSLGLNTDFAAVMTMFIQIRMTVFQSSEKTYLRQKLYTFGTLHNSLAKAVDEANNS